MRTSRLALPVALAVLAAIAPAVLSAPAASAADAFTCKSSAPVFDVRSNGQLLLTSQQEPETGADSWSGSGTIGQGWPASTYAGPNGKVYFIRADGSLNQHTWLGGSWADGGVSTEIDKSDTWKIYNTDPAYHKRLTVDSRGDFYFVDSAGTLRWKRYDEAAKKWYELVIDSGWNQYDAIFASGEGVLWARTPAGDLYRFRYHADSQRWMSRSGKLAGGWNVLSLLFSPGADIIYGVHGQFRNVWWYRYIESENRWATGSGVQPAGSGWASDATAATAAPDSCSLGSQTVPETPAIPVDDKAKAALLKTTNGSLHYAYVSANPDRRLVHAEIKDLTGGTPNGFSAFPDYAAYTGAPTMNENENGLVRVYGHGTDAAAHGYAQATAGGWSGHNNLAGRMLSAPQIVRTENKLQTMLAFDSSGALWLRPQRNLNGALQAWVRPGNGSGAPIAPGSREFTALAQGDTIVVVARNVHGQQCRASLTALVQTPWQCSAPGGFTGPAAVVPMPDNTLQLFASKTDGSVHTVRTAANGTIPDTWAPLPVALPAGVTAGGAPAALLAPEGTLQVVVRGNDGYTYRTGQTAVGGTAWYPWTEVANYSFESATDPAVSLAGGTWVIAVRTPAGDPKLLRWAPSAAVRSATTGEFVDVPLRS